MQSDIFNPRSEKRDPYRFVGREQEFDEACRFALDSVSAATAGSKNSPYLLVEGMPGIGKTCFLSRLPAIIEASTARKVVHADFNSPNDLERPGTLVQTIHDVKRNEFSEQVLAVLRRLKVGIPGFVEIDGVLDSSNALHGDVVTLLRASTRTTFWDDKVLLLTIDESQTLKRPDAGQQLAQLQNGIDGLPMLAVCAGLPGTVRAFDQFGISRTLLGSKAMQLPLLSWAETREAVFQGALTAVSEIRDAGRNLSAYSERIQDYRQALDELALETDGFPRNIQHLVGLITIEIIDCTREQRNFNPNIPRAALQVNRDEYYRGRKAPLTRKYGLSDLQALAALFSDATQDNGVHEQKFIETFKHRNMSFDKAQVFMDDCIKAGIIQPHPDVKHEYEMVPAIPSFVDNLTKPR